MCIKQFFKGIAVDIRYCLEHFHNLITWFPIIWKDRQWDDYYFFLILRKKLQEMETYYRSRYAHHLDSEKQADEISYCIERLDRIIDEFKYTENALKSFNEKYPDYNWSLENKFIETENTAKGWVEYVNNDTPEQRALLRECFEKAELDLEDDLDELFAQLRLHIREWWD